MCSPLDSTLCLRVQAPSAITPHIELSLTMLTEQHSSWHARESDHVVFDAYFDTHEARDLAYRTLQAQLTEWTDGTSKWTVERITQKQQDWSLAWRSFFHVQRVSRRIVIKPSWEAYKPQQGDCVIEIDPGMSFGTGQHETTRGCLQFLDNLCEDENNVRRFLDIGCGSGILSIAAAKLGCNPVMAIDNDREALVVARNNIVSNHCNDVITVQEGDAAQRSNGPCYDIVAANILAPVLIAHAETIASNVNHGGYLLLAGILTEQYPDVQSTYQGQGLTEIETLAEGEWTCGLFCKQHSS